MYGTLPASSLYLSFRNYHSTEFCIFFNEGNLQMKNLSVKNITILLFSVFICQLAGVVGSFFTVRAIPTWYAALNKPSFNPPNWLFAPVWTILYAMMGISLYLVIKIGYEKKEVRIALMIFGIQLILNALWSILFFGIRSPLFAFVEIIILWLAILMTIIRFYPLSSLAAILLIPYLLWVSFASVLNYFIWSLNS